MGLQIIWIPKSSQTHVCRQNSGENLIFGMIRWKTAKVIIKVTKSKTYLEMVKLIQLYNNLHSFCLKFWYCRAKISQWWAWNHNTPKCHIVSGYERKEDSSKTTWTASSSRAGFKAWVSIEGDLYNRDIYMDVMIWDRITNCTSLILIISFLGGRVGSYQGHGWP